MDSRERVIPAVTGEQPVVDPLSGQTDDFLALVLAVTGFRVRTALQNPAPDSAVNWRRFKAWASQL